MLPGHLRLRISVSLKALYVLCFWDNRLSNWVELKIEDCVWPGDLALVGLRTQGLMTVGSG